MDAVPNGEVLLLGTAPKGVALVETIGVNGEGFAGADPNAGGLWCDVDTAKGDVFEDIEPKLVENGDGLEPKGGGF